MRFHKTPFSDPYQKRQKYILFFFSQASVFASLSPVLTKAFSFENEYVLCVLGSWFCPIVHTKSVKNNTRAFSEDSSLTCPHYYVFKTIRFYPFRRLH